MEANKYRTSGVIDEAAYREISRLVAFKELLTQEQKGSFLPFLKEKCPQMKVVRSL